MARRPWRAGGDVSAARRELNRDDVDLAAPLVSPGAGSSLYGLYRSPFFGRIRRDHRADLQGEAALAVTRRAHRRLAPKLDVSDLFQLVEVAEVDVTVGEALGSDEVVDGRQPGSRSR